MSRLPPFPDRVDTAALDWRDGTPVSRAFGDVYFSLDGGIDETRHVFIDGNHLRTRFVAGGFRAFTLGETGFGTGLNLLVAMRDFLALAPPEATLHLVSVEKFPLAPDDLARAHAHWPALAALSAELRSVLPPAVTGFHHRVLCGGRVRLTLLLGDAAALLPRLDARVDAWFLDGFAPAKNDDLWTPALFAELARLSAPGATFATFTAAGDVRRGLAGAGFTVEKVPGFGRKRDMVRGTLAGASAPGNRGTDAVPAPRSVAVIGGGLAGCASARAFAERGWQVTLFERHDTLAAETSGNLAGAVYPKFSLHETPQNRWYRDSWLYALARLPQLLGEPDGDAWSRCGLLQVPGGDDDRLAEIADTGRWPADVLRFIHGDEGAALAGIPVPQGGLWFPGAGWVHPPALCRALATHAGISVRTGTAVTALEAVSEGWRVATQSDAGEAAGDARFDAVVLANARAALDFAPAACLPLRRVRGQVTHVAATAASSSLRTVVCHEGYVTPARAGLHCVGATFGPRDPDPAVREEDHAWNLAKLAGACPALHDALGGETAVVTGGRTGFRTQTPDYLPVIGPLPASCAGDDPAPASGTGDLPPPLPGVYALAALGAKGIAFSLLGAEIVAARANGDPLPVDAEVAAALDPRRFLARERRWKTTRCAGT